MLTLRSTQKSGTGQHYLGTEKSGLSAAKNDARVKTLPIKMFCVVKVKINRKRQDQIEFNNWKETAKVLYPAVVSGSRSFSPQQGTSLYNGRVKL